MRNWWDVYLVSHSPTLGAPGWARIAAYLVWVLLELSQDVPTLHIRSWLVPDGSNSPQPWLQWLLSSLSQVATNICSDLWCCHIRNCFNVNLTNKPRFFANTSQVINHSVNTICIWHGHLGERQQQNTMYWGLYHIINKEHTGLVQSEHNKWL